MVLTIGAGNATPRCPLRRVHKIPVESKDVLSSFRKKRIGSFHDYHSHKLRHSPLIGQKSVWQGSQRQALWVIFIALFRAAKEGMWRHGGSFYGVGRFGFPGPRPTRLSGVAG